MSGAAGRPPRIDGLVARATSASRAVRVRGRPYWLVAVGPDRARLQAPDGTVYDIWRDPDGAWRPPGAIVDDRELARDIAWLTRPPAGPGPRSRRDERLARIASAIHDELGDRRWVPPGDITQDRISELTGIPVKTLRTDASLWAREHPADVERSGYRKPWLAYVATIIEADRPTA